MFLVERRVSVYPRVLSSFKLHDVSVTTTLIEVLERTYIKNLRSPQLNEPRALVLMRLLIQPHQPLRRARSFNRERYEHGPRARKRGKRRGVGVSIVLVKVERDGVWFWIRSARGRGVRYLAQRAERDEER